MMKRYALSSMIVVGSLATFGQTVLTVSEYDALKSAGQLPEGNILIADGQNATLTPRLGAPKDGACDCWIEPDATYSLAMYDNDDLYSERIALPFTFNLLGQQYDSVYINNNGNVSFDAPYYTYTAEEFPSANFVMVAPFWADVDTRDTTYSDSTDHAHGQVLYKITDHAMYVNWVDVGYFSQQGDKRNTFQLIMTDGTDPAIPGGNNVSFCYKDMQWTTGSASGGENGFGGSPATVGVNRGNGIDHTQIGRFGIDSDVYNGAYSDTSGISWLDSTHFYVNTAGAGVPPVLGSDFDCDTMIVQIAGDQAHQQSIVHRLIVIPGGPGQQVDLVMSAPTLPSLPALIIDPVDYIDMPFEINTTGAPVGTHYITFTATSTNGLSSIYQVHVDVLGEVGIHEVAASNFILAPNPAGDVVTLRWSTATAPSLIELVAVDGRIARTVRPANGISGSNIDLGGLGSGTYVVRITTAAGTRIMPLMHVAD
ncbi:MAG TPA: T9SS type A sorting domain-containing protein [Flavobacteriales bacterium]|nr:T9SS type A sorting domain-containing protein [Flavobacteriales bacterium]